MRGFCWGWCHAWTRRGRFLRRSSRGGRWGFPRRGSGRPLFALPLRCRRHARRWSWGDLLLLRRRAGDGVGVDFFAGCFRCFRVGVGVGVGSRNFLIFVPNDSSAAFGTTIAPKKMATIRKTRSIALIAETKISQRVPEGRLCLTGSRPRDFRVENSRWVNARDNQRGRGP